MITVELSDVFKGVNGYTVTMKWSDNPYTFVYESEDLQKVLNVYSLLDKRLNEYKYTKEFDTSDIEGLQYVK